MKQILALLSLAGLLLALAGCVNGNVALAPATPVPNSSGQLTTATFSLPIIQTGTYYLVFDNTFSIVSTKVVNTSSALTFEP